MMYPGERLAFMVVVGMAGLTNAAMLGFLQLISDGRVMPWWEIAALVGCASLILAACLSLLAPRRAAWVVVAAVVPIWLWYAIGLTEAVHAQANSQSLRAVVVCMLTDLSRSTYGEARRLTAVRQSGRLRRSSSGSRPSA